MHKKKKAPAIVYILLALFFTVISVTGIYCFALTTEIDIKGVRQIEADSNLGDGIEAVYSPANDDTEVTDEMLAEARDVFAARFSAFYRNVSVASDSGSKTISVLLPSTGDSYTDTGRFSAMNKNYNLKAVIAEYTADENGAYTITKELETIFDNSGVERYTLDYGTTSSSYVYYVGANLTADATAKLAGVTERIYNEAKAKAEAEAEPAAEGETAEVTVPVQRYFILLDGEVLTNFTFTGKTESKSLRLASSSSQLEATTLANMLSIGNLPYETERSSLVTVAPAYGNLLDVLGIALAALCAAGVVFAVLYAKTAGAVASIIWLGQNALTFIVYGAFNRIYSVTAIFGFASALVLSFAAMTLILYRLKKGYSKGLTVEGAASSAWNAVKIPLRAVGYIVAAFGLLLLFFDSICIDLGIILVTAGVLVLLCQLYVTKWSLISTQAFGFMRKPCLFKSKKEAE